MEDPGKIRMFANYIITDSKARAIVGEGVTEDFEISNGCVMALLLFNAFVMILDCELQHRVVSIQCCIDDISRLRCLTKTHVHQVTELQFVDG